MRNDSIVNLVGPRNARGESGLGNKSIMKLFIRILLATVVFAGTPGTPSRAAETIRIAVQKTGTFAWELAVIRAHGLDSRANLAIEVSESASPEQARSRSAPASADIIVTGLAVGVARARTWRQTDVYPYSSALGAVMVPGIHLRSGRWRISKAASSPSPEARSTKNWLLLRALMKQDGIDLKSESTIVYGAPPLAGGEDTQRRNGCHRQLLEFLCRAGDEGPPSSCGIEDLLPKLGAKGRTAMIGYVFRRRMGERKPRRGFPLRRHDPRGEGDPGGLGCGVGKDRAADGCHRRCNLARLSRSLSEGIPRRPIADERPDARSLSRAGGDRRSRNRGGGARA